MKKLLLKILIIVLTVFITVNIIKWMSASVKTEIAMSGILEKAYTYEGIIIRDEHSVNSKSRGVLETKVGEGELVKRNKHIGSVYYGDMDNETQKKLASINQRINEINSSRSAGEIYSNDIYKIEAGITSKVNDIINAGISRNMETTASLKNEIDALIDKKKSINGETETKDGILEDLYKQKAEIEGKYNATKEDLFSPSAGMFSTKVDGYEGVLNPSIVKNMTVEDYRTLKKTKPENAENAENLSAICKIVNSFEWSVLILANYDLMDHIKLGKEVYIRFENQPDILAYVSYISPQDGGKYVIGITSSYSSDYAMNNRFAKLELITEKYTGLKVPLSAVRVEKDGAKGVYTVNNSAMKFKKADVIYNDGKYAIIEQKNNKDNYLLLYDEVVTSDSKCYDGKRVDLH